MSDQVVLMALVFVAAVLYSSVGHAGASGYLAAMAITGVTPQSMKPTALVLNLIVATIALVRFVVAQQISWRVLWPFLIGSIPFAFLGGAMSLPGHWYKIAVGVILLVAAVRLIISAKSKDIEKPNTAPIWLSIVIGAIIGLLAGLTGTGGGIFLSPVLIMMGWAKTRESAGISSAFILANSLAGLIGASKNFNQVHPQVLTLGIAAVFGGLIGTQFGTKTFGVPALRVILGVVLVIAGLKLALVQ